MALAAWRSPGALERNLTLPLIGPVFQWPRASKVTHHQSIILVNATILPRALGLLGFYGENKYTFAGAEPGSKFDKAKELSVKIIDEAELRKML